MRKKVMLLIVGIERLSKNVENFFGTKLQFLSIHPIWNC